MKTALRWMVWGLTGGQRAGLLALRFRSGRRPRFDFADAVGRQKGATYDPSELVKLGRLAVDRLNEGLRYEFECSPSWRLNWLRDL